MTEEAREEFEEQVIPETRAEYRILTRSNKFTMS